MFTRAIRRTVSTQSQRGFKVAVLGASGGIGQPLSLLLKLDPRVTELNLFDVVRTHGVAADVSHCNSKAKVSGFVGMEEAGKALDGANVVVIPAGVPRKPGMTRDDLFNTNASIVKGLAEACATACPNAMFLVISNPVNSTVPIFAETLKKKGVYNPRRLFGVTTLDVVRANTFVSENQKFDVNNTKVTVIGGHAGTTILPLLSQVPGAKFSDADIDALTHRIQFGGDEVVKAKDGAGSATLSMAYAAAKFANLLLRALGGEKGLVTPTFVESELYKSQGVDWFSSNVELGTEGVAKIHEVGAVTPEEQALIDACLPELAKNIAKGENFVKNS